MKNNVLKQGVLLIFLFVMLFTACGKTNEQARETDKNTNLILSGITDSDIEIPYVDILAKESEKKTVVSIPNGEEPEQVEIVGVSLEDILADYGIDFADFSLVRGIAGDGYEIDIPAEVFLNGGMYLIWEQDGKPLEPQQESVRIAVDGHRSMYWVSNLIELKFVFGAVEKDITKSGEKPGRIVFLDAASAMLEQHDITYYDAVDSGIEVKDLFSQYQITENKRAEIMAVDELSKTEELDLLNQGYFKMTGKDAPLFMSPELPKGLHIKEILSLVCGDTAFVSEQSLFAASDTISLADVADCVGLIADKYLITGADGYSVEVEKDVLITGELIMFETGRYAAGFDNDFSAYNVKDVLTIQAMDITETGKSD